MEENFWKVDWDKEFETELTEEELALFDKLAEEIVIRQMTVPALLLLEGFKPLNWIGSQLMLFLEPITVYVLNINQMQVLRRALQKRLAMEEFIKKIEAAEAKLNPGKKKKNKKKKNDNKGEER